MKPVLQIMSTDGKVTAKLIGELTVRYGNELADIFRSMADETDVHISIDNPSAMDLSLVQLMYSFKKSLKESGKTLKVEAVFPEADKTLLKISSLMQVFN